jgi:hypothetical protein
MIKDKILPRLWLNINAPHSTHCSHSEKCKTVVLVSSIGAQKTSDKNKPWPSTYLDKQYDILQAAQNTAAIILAVDGVYCNGKRVVSEETQDSVKASVTISPGSYQLQFKPLNASKSSIQGNAKELYHCQFLCIKQENEDERCWSPNSICNEVQPCIKNVSCT